MKNSWARSAVFGFVSWLLPLGLTFFATPLIIKKLGVEEYGLYALILGFIGYSFTFSIGRAVTKYVAEYEGLGQTERIKEVLAATLWINFVVGMIGTIFLCYGARFIVVTVFDIQSDLQENAIIALYLASITIFFVMLAQVFSGVIQASRRLDIFSGITTVVSVFGVLGNIVLAFLGYGVKGLLIWNLITTALSCIWFYWSGTRLIPEAKWNLKCKAETLKLIGKFAFGVTASQTVFNFLLLFERGLITRKFGIESLTYYVVPMNLTSQIHFFSASLLLMIFPVVSELGAKLEIERLRAIYEQVSKYLFAIVTFIVVSIWVCGFEFFRLWLGEEFAEKTFYIVILQAATFGMLAIGIVAWQVMEGFGYTRTNAVVAIIWVAMSLFLMIILSPILKLEGVGIGRTVGSISMLIYILWIEKQIFQRTLWSFWGRTIGLILLPILLAFLIEYFTLRYFLNGWLGLFVAGSGGAAIYVGLLFATHFFNLEDRRILHRIFFKAFPTFS